MPGHTHIFLSGQRCIFWMRVSLYVCSYLYIYMFVSSVYHFSPLPCVIVVIIFSALIHLRCHMPSKICYCSIVVALKDLFASNLYTVYDTHTEKAHTHIHNIKNNNNNKNKSNHSEKTTHFFSPSAASWVESLPFFS